MTKAEAQEDPMNSDFDDEFVEAIVPPEPPPIENRTVAIVKQLRPWHKPRKQFVRRSWSHHIRSLMRTLHIPADSSRVFRYLTLAGPDMLDIRNLEDVTVKAGFKLKYVGFSPRGSKDEAEIILAQNQMRSYDWIDRNSDTLWYRLEDIAAGDRSTAMRAVESHGPYHAINFDLCQNIAQTKVGAPSILDALIRLISLQSAGGTGSWLLFITTKIEPLNTPDNKVADFLQAINSNIKDSEEFSEEFIQLCEQEGIPYDDALNEPKKLTTDAFVKFFCLGFTKWLIGHLCTAYPVIELSMQGSHIYSVEQGSKDMLSLVYRCTPVIRKPADPNPVRSVREIEIDSGLTAIRRTISLCDIDNKMADEPQLLEALTHETHKLLKSANYAQDIISLAVETIVTA
ncbi:hypothetical protein N8H74_11910 [Pseudomonas sp. B2M1-30]|uniref:PP_RS20740 family protein n=1 Tax=Pseudomonas TaxID=286 RepID=UPI0021C82CCA|nr:MULTISPECIES: hypothetical protein [Pseudomonas]MCU0118960.1 hypothetical protein [Pseudomonas sp. B2M1-30]MCU7263919.1 hypothetical protein [Pseudomonas koreensis]